MNLREECLHISFREEVFRVSFLQPFTLIFTLALCLTEGFYIYSGNQSHQVAFVILPTILVLLCTIAVLLLQFRYKFRLGPDGIQCYDFWCRSFNTTWEEVDDVRLVNTAGLSYLQVIVHDNPKEIWIPLFVSKNTSLRHMLMTYTNHSLPVQEKLEQIWS